MDTLIDQDEQLLVVQFHLLILVKVQLRQKDFTFYVGPYWVQTYDICIMNRAFHAPENHSTKKPVTTMLTYPWKCTVLHCKHLGNTWKPLVLMTRHFDYCPSASESSAPVVSRCFPGGYNVKLHISKGRLAWWLLAFLHSESHPDH